MKKAFRIIGIIAVIVLIIAAITASMNNKPSNTDKIWDTEMTIGNPEAKNYFIVYSDLSFSMRCVLRSPVLQVHYYYHQSE